MDKRKHKRSRRFLSTLMVLAMLVSLVPAGAFAVPADGTETVPQWQVSKSKTATNLDANYQSNVTLSLPSASYQGNLDVVFVLDGSTSTDEQGLANEAANLLRELTNYENLQTKAGVVIFGGSNPILYSSELITIDETNVTTLTDEITNSGYDGMEGRSGSNLQAGVVKAQQMLAGDTAVNAEDKYMIILSDGGARMWYDADADEAMSNGYWSNANGCWWNSNEDYNARYSTSSGREIPTFADTWNAGQTDKDFDRYGMTQAQSQDPEYAAQYAASSETVMADGYYSTYETAVYHAALSITEASKGSKILFVDYPYYPDTMYFDYIDSFKSWLADNGYITRFDSSSVESPAEIFSDVHKDLIQVVDAGSYVIDEIGSDSYKMGEDTYTYDFDFVKDIDKLTLTVDGQELTSTPIDQSDATAAWRFGDSTNDDQFELYYYENGTTYGGHNHSGKECLVWKINVPIMKDTPVQLTYSVKLTNPETDAGTYGQYDANGSQAYSGLFTNNSATLYPVDSLGNANYAPEEFQKPTVSYTVGSVFIEPANITVYTGGDGYESVVDGVGSEIGDSDQGLPTPGYLITLPTEIDDKYFDGKDEASDLSNRVQFVYDGNGDGDYDDKGVDRVWKLEMYSQGEDATSQTSDEVARYVYRMDADELSKEPVRLQFTQGDQFMTSDEFEISVAELYQEFNMTIYPGELDRGNIKAQILDTEGNVAETLGVEVGDATLTIRGTTENEVINAVGTETSDVTKNDHHITAVASDADTSYVINESNVSVAPDQVSLLSDELVTTEPLQEYIVENDIADSTANYQYRYLDLVDTTNGNAWVTADKPVDIYWKLPDGASADDEFQIVHFQGLDREYDDVDTKLDQNEPVVYSENNGLLSIEKIDGVDYLKFSTRTFSPFVLVWDEASNDNPGGPVIPSDPDDPDPDTPDLNTDDHYSYIVGYPEDYRTGEATDDESLWPVKPQGNITRAEVATIFYRLLTNDARSENWTTSNSFTDVSADSWYNTPVSTLSAMGLIEGYEDGSFRPDNPITRAEFAAIAGRFFTDNDAIYEPGTFSDIEGAEWFADAVQAAKDHDIIGGYPDGSFKPNNPITRAEACSIVNRTTKRVPDADHLLALDEMRNWPDNADTSAWYYADMQEATNGHYYDYVLDDNEEIVREEWTSAREPIDWDQLEAELEASH